MDVYPDTALLCQPPLSGPEPLTLRVFCHGIDSNTMKNVITPKSLAFRAKLADLVSPLRRVRSRTPFFRLAAHRTPTLWSLYRGILRLSPTEDVKFRVRALFRQNRHLTGVEQTKARLNQGYKWLKFFKKAMDGDRHCQAVMMRYSRLIAAKRAKADLRRVMKGELERQLRARTQPIWTGGFLRPTLFHGPLPRMYPQPKPIAMIVRKRILAREKRFKTKADLEGDLEDLKLEGKFEEGLRDLTKTEFPTFFSGEDVSAEWRQPIQTILDEFKLKDQREYARAAQPFPPELVEAIFEARREKIRNKTREKERERRGERTLSALRRKRQGPPAHVLSQMTPEQREMDKVARSLSEVGYVALVKRRLGRKLKDPEAGLELGEVQNRPLLDKTREIIRQENKRRRLEELELGTRRLKKPGDRGCNR
ncbi:unnamed protein product [Cyclocybe aegerita]|uniref:Uncharacterized protein n=1 Tax=Cyclocybe aegerita TaxID=1973307 RepID=A0A8S0X1X7_CYCAE|nr:unnamed protein product [Cyclocybe aegerita]